MTDINLILGSSSPRRIEMMKEHGFAPVIIKPEVEENLPADIGMEDAVMLLSLKKALAVEASLKEDSSLLEKVCTASKPSTKNDDYTGNTADLHPYIVTADTVVYYDKIIGKPETREEAFQILSMLRGKTHFVATGVTILKAFSNIRRCFYEVSSVEFTDFSDSDLSAYVDTDEPYDKAGGYAIQGAFKKYIKGYSGDYNNIVGFPWDAFEKEFSQIIHL